MNDKKSSFLEDFKANLRPGFFLMERGIDFDEAELKHFTRRKLDDKNVSLLCWVNQDDAEKYWNDIVKGSQEMEIVEVSGDSFREFLDRQPNRRHYVKLEIL